jgi:hypothetical protein
MTNLSTSDHYHFLWSVRCKWMNGRLLCIFGTIHVMDFVHCPVRETTRSRRVSERSDLFSKCFQKRYTMFSKSSTPLELFLVNKVRRLVRSTALISLCNNQFGNQWCQRWLKMSLMIEITDGTYRQNRSLI